MYTCLKSIQYALGVVKLRQAQMDTHINLTILKPFWRWHKKLIISNFWSSVGKFDVLKRTGLHTKHIKSSFAFSRSVLASSDLAVVFGWIRGFHRLDGQGEVFFESDSINQRSTGVPHSLARIFTVGHSYSLIVIVLKKRFKVNKKKAESLTVHLSFKSFNVKMLLVCKYFDTVYNPLAAQW